MKTAKLDQRRIALMIPTLAGGGAERTYLNLAEGFHQAGYQVDLILKRATGEYLTQVPTSINLVDLNASRMALTLPGLIRYLRSRRPRVLMAGLELTHMIALAAQWISGIPTKVIVTVHSVISQSNRSYLPGSLAGKTAHEAALPQGRGDREHLEGSCPGFLEFPGVSALQAEVIYNPIITPAFVRERAASDPAPMVR